MNSSLFRSSSSRRTLTSSPLVSVGRLKEDHTIPAVIRPKSGFAIDLAEWSKANSPLLNELLLKHRALLFRGFGIDSLPAFKNFVESSSDGPFLEYIDRSSPRSSAHEKIYISTTYPSGETIHLHNEGTYWTSWAKKIYFCSVVPSETGGETPICDVRKVLARIPSKIVDRFRTLGVLYVRNFNEGFGLSWQEAFQADTREACEGFCRNNQIDYSWGRGGRLTTRQVRPAIRNHPQTGEELWFNHAAFFNLSSLPIEVGQTFKENLPADALPFNTFYGDGSPIDPDVIAVIKEAYEKEKIKFIWEKGDVMLLDNMTIAHGREAYSGTRKTLVAMKERIDDE